MARARRPSAAALAAALLLAAGGCGGDSRAAAPARTPIHFRANGVALDLPAGWKRMRAGESGVALAASGPGPMLLALHDELRNDLSASQYGFQILHEELLTAVPGARTAVVDEAHVPGAMAAFLAGADSRGKLSGARETVPVRDEVLVAVTKSKQVVLELRGARDAVKGPRGTAVIRALRLGG